MTSSPQEAGAPQVSVLGSWPQTDPDVPEDVFTTVAAEVDPHPDPDDYPLQENASFRSAVIVAYRQGLASREAEVRRKVADELYEAAASVDADKANPDHAMKAEYLDGVAAGLRLASSMTLPKPKDAKVVVTP